MISVVIPTYNSAGDLAATLVSLVTAAAEGIVREVIIVDGGSDDGTLKIADAMGCRIISFTGELPACLATGAAQARARNLLFLKPGVMLSEGWEREARHFIDRQERSIRNRRAATFRLRIEMDGLMPRLREQMSRLSGAMLGRTRCEQGLLIGRELYGEIGTGKSASRRPIADMARRTPRVALLRSFAIIEPVNDPR